MNLPIVDRIEDAPITGEAVLMLAENFCIPVRNRERAWTVDSIGGWNTKAEAPAPLNFGVNSNPLPPPEEWNAPRFVFAPTAEAAIEKYNESQPFGHVVIKKIDHYFAFIAHDFLVFYFSATSTWAFGATYDPDKLAAFHTLIAEVVAYQTAERTGAKNSNVHRAIAEMEAGK